MKLLLTEAVRLWFPRKAGDEGRGDRLLGEDIRDWKRRSNGLNEGVGLPSRGLEASDGRRLLLSEDRIDP